MSKCIILDISTRRVKYTLTGIEAEQYFRRKRAWKLILASIEKFSVIYNSGFMIRAAFFCTNIWRETPAPDETRS
jgi:hypothetical protein